MSLLLFALFVFFHTGLSVRPLRQSRSLSSQSQFMQTRQKVKLLANVDPDQACLNWLQTPDGSAFWNCQGNIFNEIPSPQAKNNCTIASQSYDALCNNSCYTTVVNGFEHILTTGDCLAVYEALYSPCVNHTDCATDGSQYCYQGNCYDACRTSADCNACYSEFCVTLPIQINNATGNATGNGTATGNTTGNATANAGNSTANANANATGLRNVTVCQSNIFNVEGVMNFRGMAYTFRSYCIKNPAGAYCAFLANQIIFNVAANATGKITNNATGNANVTNNATQTQCDLYAGYDCCLGLTLTTYDYCQNRTFIDQGLYQCNNSKSTCAPLPPASSFCTAAFNASLNGTTNGTAGNETIAIITNSSSSSGSLATSSNSSSSSSFTSSASLSSVLSFPSVVSSTGVGVGNPGTGGNSTGKGNAAGKLSVSLSLILGLMLSVLFS